MNHVLSLSSALLTKIHLVLATAAATMVESAGHRFQDSSRLWKHQQWMCHSPSPFGSSIPSYWCWSLLLIFAVDQSLSHAHSLRVGLHGRQHARLPFPPLSPGVCSNSCLLSRWCYLTISSSAALFFFCLQSFPASGSWPMSQLFASGGQSIGVSAPAPVLPVNIQCWFPLGWTGLISLKSKGRSRVFFNITTPEHQFFSAQNYGPPLTFVNDYWEKIPLTIQIFSS